MKIRWMRVFKIVIAVGLTLPNTSLFAAGPVVRPSSQILSETLESCDFCSGSTIPRALPLKATVSWDDVKSDRLGNCLLPPDYSETIKGWKRFQAVAMLKTTINAKRIPSEMKVSVGTRKYLQDLKYLEPAVRDLSVIKESSWFKNLYSPKGRIDKNFLKYAQSEAFFDNLASPNFTKKTGPNQDPKFWESFQPGSKFELAITHLQQELRKPDVRAIVNDLDKNQGISIVDPSRLSQYQEFMKFFEEKGVGENAPTMAALFSSAIGAPLQSKVPLPKMSIESNLFQKAYLKKIDKNIDDFIWHAPVTQEMLNPHLKETISTGERLGVALQKMDEKQKSLNPDLNLKNRQADLLAAFNTANAPAKYNLFDEKVATQFYSKVKEVDLQNQLDEPLAPKMAPGTPKLNVFYKGETFEMDAAQLSQVDMVARTLVGEVMDCQVRGLAQAEAVGIVIAQRMEAITAAAKEQDEVMAKNETIEKENVHISNGDDETSKFLKSEETRLLGRRDFGRPPPPFPTSLPFMSAAEAVSRKLQFSVWNPNLAKNYNTGNYIKNPNIPDYEYPIFGPLGVQDVIDQTRGLCPEIPKNSEKGNKANTDGMKLWPGDFTRTQPVWNHIADIALEIVRDPKAYLSRYAWKPSPSPKDHVYFYTHGPGLGFAHEVRIDTIHDNVTNKDLPLRKNDGNGKNLDSCNHFRAFAPNHVEMYENKGR